MPATIMWLGQAGYIVKTDHGSFALDPFCSDAKGGSERLYPSIIEKGSEHVDMVLTTHSHWDHFDPETYTDYVIPKVIIGPGSCMRALEKSGIGIEGIELGRNKSLERCGFNITAKIADHDADSVGFLVEFDGFKLFFSGDCLLTTRAVIPNIGINPDLAFVCINGKLGNMNYFEAASYCKALGAKVGIPTHYDMIRHNTENPADFVRALSRMAPDTKSFVMEKGVTYNIADIIA